MIRFFTIVICCVLVIGSVSDLRARSEQGLLDRKVTLELSDVSLSTALAGIEAAAVVRFAFSSSRIELTHIVSVQAKGERLSSVLDALLGPLGIRYSAERGSDVILLSPIEARALPGEGSSLLLREELQALVSGVVRDAATQTPMAGVNVMVRGTTRGTTTDAEGRYSIEAGIGDVLVFSFIGYKKHEVDVRPALEGDVLLEEDVESLDAVVVNAGYYKVPERKKTGSIAKVTSKEIERQPVTSLLTALQGRVTGLEITPVTGTPGSAPRIRIRGQNSLRPGAGLPLYIVDGVPLESGHLFSTSGLLTGGVDPLGTLDPASIESIEVLKDADATAIYGSRGASGVIIITTKQQQSVGKTQLAIDAYRGFGRVTSRMDLLNRAQYLEMRTEAYDNDGVLPARSDWDMVHWDTTRSTDWQKVFLGNTAHIADGQLTFSGGTGKTHFRFGLGYHQETLVIPGDHKYRRVSGQAMISHSSDDDRFHAQLSATYGASLADFTRDSYLVSAAITLPPTAPTLYREDGSLNWELYDWDGIDVSSWVNPLSGLLKTHEGSNSNMVFSSRLSYDLSNAISVTSTFGYTALHSSEYLKDPINSSGPDSRSWKTGSIHFGRHARSTWIVEPHVTFAETFGNHHLTALLGGTWQSSGTLHQLVLGQGYQSDALLNTLRGADQLTFLHDDYADYRYTALFGRVGYSFKEKYLINLTGRRDGSSRFGPGKRFGNFGAVGFAWIFSLEPAVRENVSVLSFGKVRASYGTTGSDQIPDYQYHKSYDVLPNLYQNTINLVPSALHNPDFGWEETQKLEAAIETGWFSDRVFVELAWYRNRSSNQLIQYQLPGTTGFSSILRNLGATIENTGSELGVTIRGVKSRKVDWTTSLNVTVPRNRLLEFSGIEDSPYAKTYKVGQPLSIRRLYRWSGVNPETGVHEFVDVNGDGFINDSDKEFTSPLERVVYGGLMNTIRVARFQLTFLMQFARQNSTRYMPGKPGTNINQLTDVLERWRQPGDVTDVQRFNHSFSLSTAWFNLVSSDYNEEDTSFVRMKTLTASYDLPVALLTKFRVDRATLYLQGQNLFTITSSSQLDPETGIALPPLSVVSLGINMRL